MNTIIQLGILAQTVSAPLLPKQSVGGVVPVLLKIVFGVAALLAIIFIAYGGLKYTTSNGDSNAVQSAKNTILSAVVGLVIAVSAFAIVDFVVGKLG